MPLNNPLRYGCPLCGAHMGERCVELETGDLMHNFHSERQMLAIPRAADNVRERMRQKPLLSERISNIRPDG